MGNGGKGFIVGDGIGVGVSVDVGVGGRVGVKVGPNNCPDPQPDIAKLVINTNVANVRCFMFIISPASMAGTPGNYSM